MSLINDLPLFIDPFALFGSDKQEYQKLHNEILLYIKFIRDKAAVGVMTDAELESWFFFQEVKQNWLGYSVVGNSGRGLKMKFAKSFSSTLNSLFDKIGHESISMSSHIEKACLIQGKVGKDNISDFTTNLIKKYLLEYTEIFANNYLQPFQTRKINVHKVYFDYKLEKWMSKEYILPYFSGDYIILTPKDLLTKDDNWINRHDLDGHFEEICKSISNNQLKFQVLNYFYSVVPAPQEDKRVSRKDKADAIQKVLERFPEILDFYIKEKEENKDEARSIISSNVEEVQSVFIRNVVSLVSLLNENDFYEEGENQYEEGESQYKNVKSKILTLKRVIESGGSRALHYEGKRITAESDLKIIQKLLWYASPNNIESEEDYEKNFSYKSINRGVDESKIFSFKLASNRKLKDFLLKNIIPSDAKGKESEEDEDEDAHLVAVFYFDNYEYGIITSLINELGMVDKKNIILIDAGN